MRSAKYGRRLQANRHGRPQRPVGCACARNPDELEPCHETVELRSDQLTLVRLCLPHAHELAFDLTRAIVRRSPERDRRLAVVLEVR
jgi:hypothetical protein